MKQTEFSPEDLRLACTLYLSDNIEPDHEGTLRAEAAGLRMFYTPGCMMISGPSTLDDDLLSGLPVEHRFEWLYIGDEEDLSGNGEGGTSILDAVRDVNGEESSILPADYNRVAGALMRLLQHQEALVSVA